MAEVDETELTGLRNAASTFSLLLGNPKTRSKILAAVKEIRPDVSIPEIDAAAPLAAGLAAAQKEVADFRAEIAKEREERAQEAKQSKALAEWEKGQNALRAAGWNDEGIGKIEKLMSDRGIASHEDAAVVFERLNPAPMPAVGAVNRPSALDAGQREHSEYLKKLFEGDVSDSALMSEVNAALAEVRQRR